MIMKRGDWNSLHSRISTPNPGEHELRRRQGNQSTNRFFHGHSTFSLLCALSFYRSSEGQEARQREGAKKTTVSCTVGVFQFYEEKESQRSRWKNPLLARILTPKVWSREFNIRPLLLHAQRTCVQKMQECMVCMVILI